MVPSDDGGVCLFFFFQAEDGIRDGTVTGVQTCALPIYVSPGTGRLQSRPHPRPGGPVPQPRVVVVDGILDIALKASEEKDLLAETGQGPLRSEEHTSELQSQFHLVCRLLLEKKKSRTAK